VSGVANDEHPGGGFNPPQPTTHGGADYGRFIAAVRNVQDRARAADAPDEVITEAADLLEKASALLAPYDADEWSSPSGRRLDLPNRGNVLGVPMELERTDDGRVSGWVRFPRFYLGRNGAAHGGAIGLLFDSVLGYTTVVLTGKTHQRTAFLHLDYRAIVPVEKTLQVEAELQGEEGRKVFVEARLKDGDTVLTEAHALFVRLKPGQP
jgi:acyl-coenzyme A thioesterase PaaI-like protein